jgi:DNA-binding transcriptional LysR family regulator
VGAAAEALVPVAEQIEAMMATFSNEAEALERDVAGLVRIACPADVADVVLAPLLPRLFDRYPALRVELEPGENLVDLARREADLALRTVRPLRGDLIVTRLFTLRWVLVAAPAVARKLGTIEAWTDARWVGWGKHLSTVPPARWFAKHVRDVEPAVQSDSLMVQLSLVAAGVGVALVPEPSVRHYGLAPVKIGASLREAASAFPTDELFLVTHRAMRNVPRVRVVWDALVERLQH